MPSNGDIRSFFFTKSRAVSRVSSNPPAPPPRRATAARAPPPASPSPSSSSSHSSSPLDQALHAAPSRTPSSSPGVHTPPTPLPAGAASLTPSPSAAARPRQIYAHDAVIDASDDDDSDFYEEDGLGSDGSDLSDILGLGTPSGSRRGPADDESKVVGTTARPSGVCVTPRAKRTLPDKAFFFSTPLTIRSKKKKNNKNKRYDLGSLLQLNETDDDTISSARRFETLLKGEKKNLQARRDGAATAATGKALVVVKQDESQPQKTEDDGDEDERRNKAAQQLKRRMIESAAATAAATADESEGGATGKMRVVRALDRANVNAGSREYYFLEQTEPEPESLLTAGNPFPYEKAKGAWQILADKQDRSMHFQSGFPYDVQKILRNMPDEIFFWLLYEVCRERRRDLTEEYVKLLHICDDQVRQLVTPGLLQALSRKFGATKDVENLLSPVTLRDAIDDPYPDWRWTRLETFLKLLRSISHSMNPESRATAMQILLRLGMDHVALQNFGLAQDWQLTAELVARSVPGEEWTNFCREVCASIYQSTPKAAFRLRAISRLGPFLQQDDFASDLDGRILDLKRRLASAFFFDDVARVDQRLEDTANFGAVMGRLQEEEFAVHAGTDYVELKALMLLLNTALGGTSEDEYTLTAAESRDFEAQVDKLAHHLKNLVTRVAPPQNKGIHVSRIEAKSAIEVARERLLYQVRARKPPKIQGIRHEKMKRKDDTATQREQQEFMKHFFLSDDQVEMESQEVRTASINIETDLVV